MRIVVVGYGKLFQAVIEGCLLAKQNIVGVLRVNRVRYTPFVNFIIDNLLPDDDKMFVNRLKLNDLNVPSVNSEKFRNLLVKLNPDIVFVSSWCEKFATDTINIPKIGTINLHPSLLPKYRGPNPYAQVIKHGEKETGITFHLMDSSYDTGAILHQKIINITENETGESLRNKSSLYAKEETINLINRFNEGFITPVNQNNEFATYFPQLSLNDSILSFTVETSSQMDRRIRGLTPWLRCSIPCENEFFMFKQHRILNGTTDEKYARIIQNDGETVRISTVDNKIMEFRGVYPVRYMPKVFYRLYVKHFLKVGSVVK